MKLGCLNESANPQGKETRVALSPDTAAQFIELGLDIALESGAGTHALFQDDDYKRLGVKIHTSRAKVLKNLDILLCIQPPSVDVIEQLPRNCAVIGLLANHEQHEIDLYSKKKLTAFALEFIPRITRAQTMDVLSSQSNLAGYKAVIDAYHLYTKVVPMMVTAAGTIKPSRVLVLGAGVAGLQAIATAKRLGAIVSAFDVRPDVKEQVESLGAKFIEVETDDAKNAETNTGYAKQMSQNYLKKQSKAIHEAIKESDIAICTALIPGKPAPLLITSTMLKDMKNGSIVADLAAINGGNCQGTTLNKVVQEHGVTIIGYDNFAGRVPHDSSKLYARNIFNFTQPLINKKLKRLKIKFDDEIVQSTILTHDGKIVHPNYKVEKTA